MKTRNLLNIVRAACFAALIYVTTAFLCHIPITNQGYIHLGDSLIYLSAVILPLPYAIAAATIGAGLADALSGAIVWLPATIIIKAIMTLYFTRGCSRLFCRRNIFALALAGLTNIFGYYLFSSIFIAGNFIAPLSSLPFDLIQSAANAVIFGAAAFGLDRTGLVERLKNP